MATVYLYVKQHSITGLKYFGKTVRDPNTYFGSGTYWNRHIDKHGREHVETFLFGSLKHNLNAQSLH